MQETNPHKNTEVDDIVDESLYYKTFFGKSAAYYEKIYKRMLGGESIIFNPYACFLSVFWMAYRKMYVELVVFVLAVGMLNNFILLVMGFYPYIWTALLAVIFAGCYANIFYMKKAERTMKRARESYRNTEEQLDYIEHEGGVSFIGPVIVLAVIVIVTIVFIYLVDYIIERFYI